MDHGLLFVSRLKVTCFSGGQRIRLRSKKPVLCSAQTAQSFFIFFFSAESKEFSRGVRVSDNKHQIKTSKSAAAYARLNATATVQTPSRPLVSPELLVPSVDHRRPYSFSTADRPFSRRRCTYFFFFFLLKVEIPITFERDNCCQI